MAGVWHRAPSGHLNCRFRRLRKRIRKSIPCCFSKTSPSCTAPESNKPECTECAQNRRWPPCLACRRAEDKAIDSDSMGTGVRRSAMSGSSSQATHAAEHSSLPERRLPCNSSKIEDLVEDHGPPYKVGPDAFVGASPFVGASFVFGAVVFSTVVLDTSVSNRMASIFRDPSTNTAAPRRSDCVEKQKYLTAVQSEPFQSPSGSSSASPSAPRSSTTASPQWVMRDRFQ